MTTETDTHSELSQTRKRLRLVAAVLASGVAIEIAAAVAVAEKRNPSGFVLTALMFVEIIVSVLVIATTIEVAEERSPRLLLLVSLAITATPFASVAVLSPFMAGGHDSATFAVMYFTFGCVISE